jgi:tape measure domain-containing protein
MATLYFKVSSDYDEVIRLRKECEKLEAQLKKMDVNKSPAAAKALETQLASARQQMMGLVTEAAKAGAVMENDLKKKLNSASKASDELTEEIIKQRKIIRDTQDDVRRLSDEYSKMGKYSPNSKAKLAELNRAKAALNEQRYSLGELQDQQARNRLEVRKLTREYKDFSSGTNNADEIVKSLTDSLKRTAVEIGGLVAIKKFGSDVIEATGKMQQLQVALSTILQDKSKADQLIADIVQFAAKTPFNLDDVATGAKQLLAYGSSADNVVNELSMLGDVASGLQIPIGQLIYLYGTLRTQGRAMTVDIRQFAGRGIPIYEELAKVLGVSEDQVGELVKEGKVGFKEVEQTFKNMTSEGGKFANLMESSAGTWPQRLSNIENTLFQKMNEFGNKYKEVFEFGIGTAEDLVESLDDVLSVMGGLIAAYGTYKAALITAAVAQKAVGFVESIRLIGMYRKELGLATAAQQAFNVASKSNVYVTLLAALVGIGTAIYMFTKRTNEATVAQETLNSVNKKADEEFSKQAATVDRLSGVLKSETSSLDQKKKALSDLQAIIPSYNASLDEEGRLINNNTEAIKSYLTQLEKQIRMKAAQEELEELYRKKRVQEKQQKVAMENYNEAKSLYNSSVTMTGSALQNRGVNTGVTVFSQNSAVNNQLKDSANKAKKELDSVNKELGETVSAITELEKEIEKSSLSDNKESPQSSISKEVKNATKRIKTLKQEISNLRSGKLQAEAGKTVESAIKAKEKELQSAEKTLETLTGARNKDVSRENATTSAGGKLSDLERKQAIERAKEAVDMENQVEQSRIDAMADGGDKILAQRELNNKKEMQAIDRSKEEYIQKEIQRQKEIFEATEELKAKQNPKYKKKSFDSSSVTVDTSMFDSIYDNTKNKQVNDRLKDEIEANERYLKNYGTFLQKRQAITDEYTRKISEATTQGDKDILQKEMEKALSSLDLEKLKQGINWELVFGDLEKVSKESLNKVKQQLRDFKNSDEYKNMAVDQKKVIDEALNNIQSTLIDKGGLLADLPEQLSELAKAQEELSQAQEEYNETMRSGTDEQKEAATKKLNDAQKRQQNAQVNVQKSTDKTTSNLVTLSNVITQLGSNSEMSLSQVGSLAGDVVDVFTEAGSKIGGIIGAAFSLLDAIGTQGLDGFVGNIFSSVFKSVGGIWDTLTFGGFSKLFGIGGNEKEVQDTINRLTDRNEKLQSAIESLTEEMKSSKGSEKSVAEYNKAIKYQEEYNKNVLAKAQANAGYHSKHHSWAYYMGWSESDIQWIRENVMAEFTGTDSLWQMSPEQMDLLRQNVDLWQKMADSGKGGYGNSVVDALGEYADLAGNLEELKEGLFEQLTGISFDSMYDSFIDTLMDMDASAEDFADNLSEYFMRAMLSDKIGNMYSQKLEDWWNRFGESMKDGNLSESERNSLQNEYMGYVNEALKLRDELAAATGYDKAGSSSQQSASSRGFGTEMTHEDAGELSGRFTAVYESNLRIETAEQQQTVAITELRGSISALTSQVTGLYNIADETRTILANSYLELQQIRENTGEIVKPIKQMQADIAEVKRNTSRL